MSTVLWKKQTSTNSERESSDYDIIHLQVLLMKLNVLEQVAMPKGLPKYVLMVC